VTGSSPRGRLDRLLVERGLVESRTRAMALIASGVVRADRIVTHRVPLTEAPEAFRLARAGGDVLKVMVTNDNPRG